MNAREINFKKSIRPPAMLRGRMLSVWMKTRETKKKNAHTYTTQVRHESRLIGVKRKIRKKKKNVETDVCVS
jgi:hypothetical protein